MELLDVIDYDKEEGKLYWKVRVGPRGLVGQEVGHLNKKGYRRFSYKGKNYFVSHVIWFIETGEWPKNQIDHEDRDKTNNRFVNLRELDNYNNSLNKLVKGSSKYVGVSFVQARQKWQAFHHFDGTNKWLGYFDTEEDANEAYKSYVGSVR